MSIIIKGKVTKEVYKNGNYRILGFSPISSDCNKVKINMYGNISLVGELGYLNVNENYEIKIEEKSTDKYGTSYTVLSVPSLAEIDLKSLSREESKAILMTFTTENQANNILEAYPDFIDKVVNEGEESIDVKKIYGVGKVYLKAYVRELNERYKYVHLIKRYSDYEVNITDCKELYDKYITEEKIEEAFNEPYYVLIEILGRGFERADKLLCKVRPDLIESEQRCEAMIMDVLHNNENEGSSRLKGSELWQFCQDYDNRLLPMVKNVCENSKNIYYNNETKDVAIMNTYLGEVRVANFIKDKINNSEKLDLDWEKYRVTDDGFSLSDSQLNVLKVFCESGLSIVKGYSGCVDADTEYFNGTEWKKISEYTEGEEVLQWNNKIKEYYNRFELVNPLQYIKKSCYTMYYIKPLGQMLSEEHRIIYFENNDNEEPKEILVKDLINNIGNYGYFDGAFPFVEHTAYGFKSLINKITLTKDDFIEVVPKGGYKYCFTVPSSYLVLRRNNKIFITGNCGKTFSVKQLIKMIEDAHMTYTLVSPTGKASRVLAEQTNRQAFTIHKKCFEGEINTDVIIVDESGMVGLDVMNMLISACTNDKSRFVFVGDPAQIPSISLGKIYEDMIKSEIVPSSNLTEVFRYKSNGSLFVATNVRQGKSFFKDTEMVKNNGKAYTVCDNYKFIETDEDDIAEVVINEYYKLLNKGIKPKDILILAPQNVGEIGTYAINNIIQAEVNPPRANEVVMSRKIGGTNVKFRVGDLVINTKNDYKAVSYDAYIKLQEDSILTEQDVCDKIIVNGQIGIIREVLDKEGLLIQFDEDLIFMNKGKLNQLLLGYSISTFKAQGSTTEYTINIISSKHKRLLSRGLLYVADTRNKKQCVDIGSIDAYETALNININDTRNTFLLELLTQNVEKDLTN